MERRALGSSGLEVPVLGVGTWRTFDVRGHREEEAARARVDEAFAAGAAFFDSSPMYGEAERALGLALEGRRERAQVATQVWTSDDGEAESPAERSLAFFGGRIDLYQVHKRISRMLERIAPSTQYLPVHVKTPSAGRDGTGWTG